MICLACRGKVLEPQHTGTELELGERWCRCTIGPMIAGPIEIVPRPLGLDSGKGISIRFMREYDVQADNANLMQQRYRDMQRLYAQLRNIDDLIVRERYSLRQALPPGFGEADENDTILSNAADAWTDAERQAYRERQAEAGRRSGRYAWDLTPDDKVFLRVQGIAVEEEE